MQPFDCKTCSNGAVESDRSNAVPMVGRRFGRLTVEGLACFAPRCWKCLCDCARTTIVEGSNLRRKVNGTKSCGKCPRHRGVPRYSELRKKKEASDARTV